MSISPSQSSSRPLLQISVVPQPQPSSVAPLQSLSTPSPQTSALGMQHISSTMPSQSLSSESHSSSVEGHTSSGLSAQNARWLPSSTSWNGIQNAAQLGSPLPIACVS